MVVHVVTASGVFVGFLGLNAVIEGHARAAILWLVAALILDGIDGPFARKLNVRERIPQINGNSLDLIVDYFTCTIVPSPSSISSCTCRSTRLVSSVWRSSSVVRCGWRARIKRPRTVGSAAFPQSGT